MDSYTDVNGTCCPSGHNSCLPCCPPDCRNMNQFPVAMAFVPWQQWQPTYAPDRGLAQGTIFPGLDLPFKCGRCGI